MDADADADDGIALSSLLFDVEVDADLALKLQEADDHRVPRSASNLSVLSLASAASNASTALLDAHTFTSAHSPVVVPRTLDGGALLIEVFCTFNGWIVRIEYPTQDNGWTYRADLGGHSHHRWEYNSVLILMARHSTCGRSVFPRELCRNCVMKTIWRRECIDPCNTFYLHAMHTVQAAIDLLRPMVYEAVEATEIQSALYMKNAPKTTVSRKRVNASTEKQLRMLRLEQNLKEFLTASNGAVVTRTAPRSFYDELGDEMDKKDAAALLPSVGSLVSNPPIPMPSVSPPPPPMLSDTTPSLPALSAPSPKRTVVSATPSPVHILKPTITTTDGVVVAERAEAAPLPPPPSAPVSHTGAAYDAFIDKLIDFNTTKSVNLDASFFTDLQTDFPNMYTSYPMLALSVPFDNLVKSLGISGNSQVLLKASLSEWIDLALKSFTSETLTVSIGFYAPPSVSIFNEIYRLARLPAFIANAFHRIETDFGAASARTQVVNTRPVLVAYFGGTPPMIPGSHICPLGVVHD